MEVQIINQIKEKRLIAGFTQAYVATKLGLKNKSTVAKWETNGRFPRVELLPKIATLYGCTVDELLATPCDPQVTTHHEAGAV